MFKKFTDLKLNHILKTTEKDQFSINAIFNNSIDNVKLQRDIKSYSSKYDYKSIIRSAKFVIDNKIALAVIIDFTKKYEYCDVGIMDENGLELADV